MNNYINQLIHSPLFLGVDTNELDAMLSCLIIREKSYQKGAFILRRGEMITSIGMVVSGSAHVVQDDFWGNRNIISEVLTGQLFGEAYACSHGKPTEISVVANEACTVLFLEVNKILTVCTSACSYHTKLIANLSSIVADKNLLLTKKIGHMTKRSTREKLLSYLSSESMRQHSATFKIPFNRQQLAEYLSVDRSAMSNELSKLREEGYLDFQKNNFTLKESIHDNY